MKVHSRHVLDTSDLEADGHKERADDGAEVWHFTLAGPEGSGPLHVDYMLPTSACNGRLVWRRGESELLVWDADTDLDFT